METDVYKKATLELKKVSLFLDGEPAKINIIKLMDSTLTSTLPKITAYTGSSYSNSYAEHSLKTYRNKQRKLVEDFLHNLIVLTQEKVHSILHIKDNLYASRTSAPLPNNIIPFSTRIFKIKEKVGYI